MFDLAPKWSLGKFVVVGALLKNTCTYDYNFTRTLVAVLQQCPHSAQYGGVCSLCGMEVKEFDKHTFSTVLSTESRDLKITHDVRNITTYYPLIPII